MRGFLEHMPRWAIIPGLLICLALAGAGIAVGQVVGKPPATTVGTIVRLVRQGTVVTVRGKKMVRLPPRTVTRDGTTVRLAAQTVPYAVTSTSVLPASTIVRNGTTVTIPASTVISTVVSTATDTTTVSVPVPGTTVTEPGTTVTEPGTTVTETVTVTEPGTTTTVTTASTS